MTNWISYFVVIPLFPIITALALSLLKSESLQYQSIFGGTELYMLSVVLLAGTRSDLERSPRAVFKTGNYRRVTTLLIPAMLLCSVFYGIVFMNLRAENPDFSKDSIAVLGLILGIPSIVVCGFLQYKLRSFRSEEVSS